MFKFIIQEQELDVAVVKLRELADRLDGNGRMEHVNLITAKDVVTKRETKLKEIMQELTEADDEVYVDESEIGKGLPDALESVQTASNVGLELDSEGIPWDARIHASSKAKVADGTWRARRNVDENLYNKIKTELRGSASRPSVQQAATPPVSVAQVPASHPVHVAPVVPAVQEVVHTHVAVATPVVTQASPVLPATPPMPTANFGHTLDSFRANFPLVLSSLITQGKVSQEYVEQLKGYFKVDQIWNLNDLQKEEMFNTFVQYQLIQKVG